MSDLENLDSSDRTFVNYLKEISQSYSCFNKQLRIRIEKWVEKLTQTGNNPTWKKHRNAYAKLLLNCVLAKSLTEPFNAPPPDGALPTFPSHLRCNLKDMLGARESSFWRDVFESIGDKSGAIVNPDLVESDKNSSIMSRSLQDCQLLIREQTKRIELLEQQLRDERLHNELQIHRSQFAHRMEIENLRKHAVDVVDAAKGYPLHSSEQQPAASTSFHTNTHEVIRPNTTSAHINSSNSSRFSDSRAFNGSLPPSAHRPRSVSPAKRNNDKIPAFDFLKEQVASMIGRKPLSPDENRSRLNESLNTSSYSSYPRKSSLRGTVSPSKSAVRSVASMVSDANDVSLNSSRVSKSLSFDSTTKPPAVSKSVDFSGNAKKVAESSKSTGKSTDDFLAYLETFQREVRSMRAPSPVSLSASARNA